ncbi:MAG: type I methionyl aminopeptidase [Firmicutes bacterium]|jgi:methionyl aminopeptidase|nr:type I methionyl aminopeptidase [Bacillota bacterium]
MISIKTRREIELMRAAGAIVAGALAEVERMVAPGTLTIDIDRVVEEYVTRRGAIPAFKGFRGFPASACVSINEEVVHGIPGPRRLNEGDIVSVDVGAIVEGYVGDAAVTIPVGRVSAESLRLIQVTRECLERAIAACVAGGRLSDIGHAVQTHAELNGFSVVRDYVGHGIGKSMHEDPQVPNFGPPGMGPVLRPGMTLALEPMINAGGSQVKVGPDRWTVVTADGSRSAHFEHTVALTEDGPLVLTAQE